METSPSLLHSWASTSSNLLHKLYYDSATYSTCSRDRKVRIWWPGLWKHQQYQPDSFIPLRKFTWKRKVIAYCSVHRYPQYKTGIKNTRASSIILCRTCHPNPIFRPSDVTEVEHCPYAKKSSQVPSIFIAHIVFNTILYRIRFWNKQSFQRSEIGKAH